MNVVCSWLCGAATGLAHNWTSIDGHSCNRYDDAAEKRKVDGARRKVLRYAHYYERYKAHGDSRRAEAEKLGPAIEARARRLREDPDPATAPASGDAAEALAAAHPRCSPPATSSRGPTPSPTTCSAARSGR